MKNKTKQTVLAILLTIFSIMGILGIGVIVACIDYFIMNVPMNEVISLYLVEGAVYVLISVSIIVGMIIVAWIIGNIYKWFYNKLGKSNKLQGE